MQEVGANGQAKNLSGINQGENILIIESDGQEISQESIQRTGNQHERDSGDIDKDANSSLSRGEFNQREIVVNLKKLVRRLELLAQRLELLEEKHYDWVDRHRDRLIERLNENQQFTSETRTEANSLRQELAELKELSEALGVSKIENQ